MLNNFIHKFNPISAGNIINSAGQLILVSTVMIDFEAEIAAKFLIYMTAATVALNHYRNYLPTILNKRIWHIDVNVKIHMLFVFLGGCAYFFLQQSLYTFFFSNTSSLFESIFWLPFLVFGFTQVFYVIISSARGARMDTGISLAIGGIVMFCFSLMTLTDTIRANPVFFFTASYFVQSVYLIWAMLRSDISPEHKNNISHPSLKNYFLYFALEAPTRPIPFLEKSIASLAGPVNVIAIEVIQRFFLRPVSLVASGNILDKQNKLLSLEKSDRSLMSIFLDIARIYKSKIVLIYPISAVVVYIFYNDIAMDSILVIGVICYSLNLVIVEGSDLCRKYVLGFESAVYSMSINLGQGFLNLLLLYLLYHFDITWAIYPMATIVSVIIGWLTYVTFKRAFSL